MSVFKVIQKRVYDILSQKHSTLLCFFGIVIIIVSAFHFGEIVLEWSKEKYQAVFYSLSDNIAEKTYQNQLCQHVPMDVVYTWVNGTDPLMLAELKRTRRDLELELNISQITHCTYTHCVQSHLLLVKPSFLHSFTLDDLEDADKVLGNVTGMFGIETKLKEGHCNFTVLIFSNVESALRAVEKQYFYLSGTNYTMKNAFLTDDWMADNAVLLKGTYIMTGIPQGITSRDIQEKLTFTSEKVFLYQEKNLAVITTNAQPKSDILNITLNNKSTKISPAYLVVEPLVDIEDAATSRFADNEELRYSLRSLEKNAPWIRHIYLVTNGQIPYWLNLDSSRISVITHEDIFPNKSHLPTFSSPAIETHIHCIPGLSKKFLYLNDDVFFGAPVWPDDFYSHSKGHKVYLSWPVPDCAEGCPTTWIKDGYCDKPCNNTHCQWDGGDCSGENVRLTYAHHAGSALFQGNVIESLERLYCNPSCSDSWLSDRYCDQACNVRNCAFDAGDCGTENYRHLYQLHLETSQTVYHILKGVTIAFFNLTSFMQEMGTITLGDYEDSPVIRTMAVSLKYKILTIILHAGFNETLLNVSLKGISASKNFDFSFLVDTRVVEIDKETMKVTSTSASNVITDRPKTTTSTTTIMPKLETFPKNKRFPHGCSTESTININFSNINVSASDFPQTIQSRIKDLEQLLQNGWITEKGFKRKKAAVISHYLNYLVKNETSTPSLIFNHESNDQSVIKIPAPADNSSNALVQKKLRTLKGLQFVSESTDYGFLPWEKLGIYNYLIKLRQLRSIQTLYEAKLVRNRKLMDTYGDSLLHVNKLFNAAFGYEARKVPAHMAHLVDVDVAERLQKRFADEFDITSSHKIRSPSDMQFAFSYYYYLMHEVEEISPKRLFDLFDTDHSGTWSDREIRTLLTRLNDLPLRLEAIVQFEETIINCSKQVVLNISNDRILPPDERYFDSNLPTVTEELILNCYPVMKQLKEKFSPKKINKFETVGEEEVAFKMIHSNLSLVIGSLDDIRKHPKKFICLNDNLHHDSKESGIVKAVLKDFYESLFPIRSQFELPPEYKNRFLYVTELKEWRQNRNMMRYITYVFLAALIIISLSSLCTTEVCKRSCKISWIWEKRRKRDRRRMFQV